MKCYICEKAVHNGGTRYAVAEAVGICHNCGVAVCLDHSHKSEAPGSPLLCPNCSEKRATQTSVQAKPTFAPSKT